MYIHILCHMLYGICYIILRSTQLSPNYRLCARYKKDTQVDREIMVAKEEQLIEELAKDFPSISSVSKKVSKSSRRKKTEAVKATI